MKAEIVLGIGGGKMSKRLLVLAVLTAVAAVTVAQ
jgi:hypothetical protein